MDLRERGDHERRHPWEVARSRFFRRLVAEHADLASLGAVLDIGAGDSWFARELLADLAPGVPVVCWDVHYDADDLAAAPPGVSRSATAPDRTFDLVAALDVLEHVDDDDGFLREQLVPALAPDGVAVVSVPAHPGLWSDHDRMLDHRRRYRPGDFRALVARHLDVVATGSLFTSLLAPRLVEVALERAGRHADPAGVGRWGGGHRLTAAIVAALDLDAGASTWLGRRGVAMPGLSAWAVARLPGAAR